MTATTDLDTLHEESMQNKDAFAARSAFENLTTMLLQTNIAVQTLVDEGHFNTIPIDLKQTLNRWWTITKDAETAIEADQEIMDTYAWRP